MELSSYSKLSEEIETDSTISLKVEIPIRDENICIASEELKKICKALDMHDEDAINIICLIAKYEEVLRMVHVGMMPDQLEKAEEFFVRNLGKTDS